MNLERIEREARRKIDEADLGYTLLGPYWQLNPITGQQSGLISWIVYAPYERLPIFGGISVEGTGESKAVACIFEDAERLQRHIQEVR